MHAQKPDHFDCCQCIVNLMPSRHVQCVCEIAVLECGGFQCFGENLTVGHRRNGQRCTFLQSSFLHQTGNIHRIVRREHHRASGLDDAGFLCSNFGQRVAQNRHVVKGNGGDGAYQWVADDVGCIQQTANACFQNHEVTLFLHKPQQRDSKRNLKLRTIRRYGARFYLFAKTAERIHGNVVSVDLNAIGVVPDKRRGKCSGSESGSSCCGCAECDNRPFPVGSGNVNCPNRILRIPQLFQQCTDSG